MRSPTEAAVAFLRRPSAYPEGTRAVQQIETHLSRVFLTDTRVYKLKKPLRLDVLDLRTVAARRRNCLEEVRLNRRLAPDVYFGALPLVRGPSGFTLGGAGEAVDWLVVMRRLPAALMLDRVIDEGRLDPTDVLRVGRRLASFYRAAPPAEGEQGYLPRLRREARADAEALRAEAYGLPTARVEEVTGALAEALLEWAPQLNARARAGRVIEGHGDLRPEHVCLEPAPVTIDCLEFSRELRLADPVDELGFLGLECARLGAPQVRDLLLTAYGDVTGDRPPRGLVDVYQAFRACRRAKIAVWHLDDPEVADRQRWQRRALETLDQASARLGARS